MENNEIMMNDEVIEEVMEVAVEPKSGLNKIAAVGLGIVAGVVICKVAQKIVAKVKKAKAEKAAVIEGAFEEVEDDYDSTEEV